MTKNSLKRITGFLKPLAESQDPGLRHFAKIVQWEISFFDRLGKTARQKGAAGVHELLRAQDSPFSVGGVDVYGGGSDRWFYYFWAILFPEKYREQIPPDVTKPHFILGEGEIIGGREQAIILGLLTSPPGRVLLFGKVMNRIRERFGNRPPWPREVVDALEDLLEVLSICPKCGMPFLGSRKGVKYCGEVCRRRDHAVPSFKRKDTTPRMYFARKLTEGFSREDAWTQTKKQHGVVLTELGLDGPHPPKSWAQEKEK